jgi:2'-5' RNA ligase
MAIVGFAVPHETARILSEIEVPGVKEPVSNFHITVLMLDDDTSISVIADAMEAAYSVASTIRPFTARVTRVTSFPGGDDGVPVICPVEAPELHAVWSAMKAAFDAKNVGYSRKFPEFKPHVTLSYADKPFEAQIPVPIEWGAHELVVWGGDRGDRRIVVHLPFTLTDRVANRYRIAKMRSRVGFQGRSGISVTNRLVARYKSGY